jgi:aminoglycoside phosphotransferase (APT) family kinase protein
MLPEVKPAEVDAAVAAALPGYGGVKHLEPLLRGHGHQSFVLDTRAGERLLLKIALRGDQLGRMRALRGALDLAAAHGVPLPRLLHFSEGTAAFAGCPWLVQEFLPGEDGEVALARMSPAERTVFFRDFGAAVARLHAIDVGYFAEAVAGAERHAAWAPLVAARLERMQREHRAARVLTAASLDAAAAAIAAGARAVSDGVRPALVHRDLYLPNTLVTDGRFRCLLDFEHARAADVLTDFVKLGMWVFDAFAGAEAAFCQGYGVNPRASDEGRRRHDVALGLELLSGLLYWQKTGETAMLADYRERLRRWLSGR